MLHLIATLQQVVPFQLLRRSKFATKAAVEALNTQTLLFGALAAVVALAIAALIANLIAHEGGANPRDPQKRRMWFWSVLSTATVAFFAYHQFRVLPSVARAWTSTFIKGGLIPGTLLLIVLYVTLGFVMSRFVLSSTKVSSWFPRKGGR